MEKIRKKRARDKISQNGDVPLDTHTEATALYANEHVRWSRAVKAANVKPG
jgi:hypothetical protein